VGVYLKSFTCRILGKLTVKTDSICLYPPIFTALINHCHEWTVL